MPDMPEAKDSLSCFRAALKDFQAAQSLYHQEAEGLEACLDQLEGRLWDVPITPAKPLAIPGGEEGEQAQAKKETAGILIESRKSIKGASGRKSVPGEECEWKCLTSLLDASPSYVHIWCRNSSGRLLYANQAASQAMGFPALVSDVSAAVTGGLEQADLEVLRTGQASFGQVETRDTSSGSRWIRVNRHPMKNGQGHVIGVIAFGIDVTDLRQAEVRLSASEQRYRTLFETMTEGFLLCEIVPEGEGKCLIQDANPAFEMATGLQLSKIRSLDPREALPALDGCIQRALGTRAGAGDAHPEDLLIAELGLCFEVRSFWPEENQVALVFNDVTERRKAEQRMFQMNEELETLVQERTRALEMAIDELSDEIEERKHAEEALRTSEEQFRLVADFTYDWEYWINLEGRHIYVSPSCERVTGLCPQAFKDDPELLERITHPEDRPSLREHLDAINGERPPGGIEFRIIRLDGSTRWIGHWCQPVFGSDGRYLGRRASNRDITERKRQERLQAARLRVLEQLTGPGTLEQCLRVLLEHVDEVFPEHPASILLLDAATGCLHSGGTAGLPDFYNAAIEGLKIGPEVGSCGAACHTGKRVVADNLEIHPHWTPFRELARQAGLGACWSEPILASTGQILGTFAIYAKAPESPSAQDLELLWEIAHLAGMVIERKRAEATLRLRDAAVDAAANAIVLTDREGRVQWMNAAFTQLTGYPPEEALGGKMNMQKSGLQDAVYYQELWDTILAGKVWHGELVNRRKDGSFYSEEQTITPFADESGELTHFIAIKQDITARKQGQEQLRKLSRAVEASPNGTVITDIFGIIEYVNPRFTEITGYSSTEALGQNPRILQSGLTPPTVYQDMWTTLLEGRLWRGELCNRRKNGELFWQKLSIAPVIDASGVIHHLVAITEDVTEHRQLEESRARLAAAVDQSAEAVAILNEAKQVLFANPAFYQILNLSPETTLGKDFTALLEGSGGETVLANAIEASLEGRSWQGRVLAFGLARAQIHLEGSISPVRDPEGKIGTLVAVFRDVTKEVEMDRHLRQAQKMDALGALAGGVAHDFNNILSAILTATELIEWQLEANSPVRSKLEIIYQAAQRAGELNKQILTFSRQTEDKRIPFDLSNVAKEVATLLRATLPANLAIQTEIASSIWVTGDPSQLHQVFMNLAINGYHAMKEGGGTLSLGLSEIEVKEGSESLAPADLGEGRFAVLTVSDTGCGMDPETLEKVFEPFFTTKVLGEGTGLGLAVVHGIVHKHGGSIQVSSEPGKGTRFLVTIPCTTQQVPQLDDESEEDLGGTERILLVDDEDIVAALAKQGLQTLGYRITAKTSPFDAIEVFQENPEGFDLLVTDLAMPGLSGAELTKRLRKIRPDLPAILVTGAFQIPDTPLSLTVSYDDLLSKPLVTKELARAIRKVMECRRLQTPAGGSLEKALTKGEGAPEGSQSAILFAEDSSVTRSLLRSWLAKGGYRVQVAKDGQEAWEMFRAAEDPSAFSLVLTDLDMPRMNGLELVEKVRKKDPEIPVLILSASEDMDSLKQALHLHVNEFLNKPFDSKELLEHVKGLVAKRKSGMETLRAAETAQAVRLAQRSMEAMPEQDLPIYSICEPLTDAGGDVFRCIRRPDGSVVLVLADVAGHSVISSYAVASFLGMLSTFVQDWWGLMDLFHRLNQNIQQGPFPEIAIAVLAAHWDPRTGRLQVVNAGNPYGVWHRKHLGRTDIIALKGTPLGLFDEPRLREKVLVLEEGDRVLFGSDGLFDTASADNTFFRDLVPLHWERAAELPLGQALGALCEAAKNHGNGRISDDVLVVGLEQPLWLPEPHELLRVFPSVIDSVDLADQAMEQLLDEHPQWRGLNPSRRFHLFLALHEAVTNAIAHGNGGDAGKRVALACRLTEETALVRVVDEGLGFNLEAYVPPGNIASERSRGVPILRASTDSLRMRGGELEFHFDLKGAAHDTRS